jgi:hypothetical protein
MQTFLPAIGTNRRVAVSASGDKVYPERARRSSINQKTADEYCVFSRVNMRSLISITGPCSSCGKNQTLIDPLTGINVPPRQHHVCFQKHGMPYTVIPRLTSDPAN